jgi:hypothetical protein
LILDGHTTGLLPENKNNSTDTSLRQKEKEITMGVPLMTIGMQGGNRFYAGSFWHKVRKKPNFGRIKAKKLRGAYYFLRANNVYYKKEIVANLPQYYLNNALILKDNDLAHFFTPNKPSWQNER